MPASRFAMTFKASLISLMRTKSGFDVFVANKSVVRQVASRLQAKCKFSLKLPSLLVPPLDHNHQAQQSSRDRSQDKQLSSFQRPLSSNRCGQSTVILDGRRKSTLR